MFFPISVTARLAASLKKGENDCGKSVAAARALAADIIASLPVARNVRLSGAGEIHRQSKAAANS